MHWLFVFLVDIPHPQKNSKNWKQAATGHKDDVDPEHGLPSLHRYPVRQRVVQKIYGTRSYGDNRVNPAKMRESKFVCLKGDPRGEREGVPNREEYKSEYLHVQARGEGTRRLRSR